MSYHKTLKGANSRIDELVELEIKNLKNSLPLNSESAQKSIKDQILLARKNQILITQGTSHYRSEVEPLFYVTEYKLMD